ncbi:MAG: hypothetical protein CME26_05005, partial [Gemmatimonadetes bacterium]|nr:hypothetical protein [Gemmatimonadota bacterium]
MWTRFTTEDGLISHPTWLLITSQDEVWVSGSHNREAAVARFEGRAWALRIHSGMSWGLDPNGQHEAHDGTLWFAAAVGMHPEKGHTGDLPPVMYPLAELGCQGGGRSLERLWSGRFI